MCSEGYSIDILGLCVRLCICLSIIQHLTTRVIICATNELIYSAVDEDFNRFSENALFKTYSIFLRS